MNKQNTTIQKQNGKKEISLDEKKIKEIEEKFDNLTEKEFLTGLLNILKTKEK